jgi:hypothetical protein
MHDVNLSDAFAAYKVKPAFRGRSAVTAGGDLVVSCWYAGFKKAERNVLRYEEDLASEAGSGSDALRAHVRDALDRECDVRLIVAVGSKESRTHDKEGSEVVRPARTTYHARKDLVGQIASFDGQRFVIEFRRPDEPAGVAVAAGAVRKRMAS